jgi:malonyl-CoA O-methyltransferase
LRRRHADALVIACDIAPGMLAAARRQQRWWRRFERVCADAYRLPFADASVDLVFSSLMLQWCDDLDGVLAEIQRVLGPAGVLTFASFGPDTLRELRAAWATVDDREHVNDFIDMHDVGDALIRAGFADPVLDVDRLVVPYDDVLALMRDLKSIGAHNVNAGRSRGLTGRGALSALRSAYETHRQDGRLPATYEVVYGTAWGGGPRRPAGVPGESVVPLSQVGRRARSSQ